MSVLAMFSFSSMTSPIDLRALGSWEPDCIHINNVMYVVNGRTPILDKPFTIQNSMISNLNNFTNSALNIIKFYQIANYWLNNITLKFQEIKFITE